MSEKKPSSKGNMTPDQYRSYCLLMDQLTTLQQLQRRYVRERDLIPEDWSIAHRHAPCTAPKCKLTLRLDRGMVDWYRKLGHGWQTRMNEVLWCYMHASISKMVTQPGEQTLPVDTT